MVCGGRSRMRLSLGLAASQVGVLQFSVARSPGSPSNHFLANPPLSSHTFKFPVARSTHGPREQKTVCNLAGRRRASRSSPHLVLPLRELAAIRAKSENYGYRRCGVAVTLFIYHPPSADSHFKCLTLLSPIPAWWRSESYGPSPLRTSR